MSRGSRSKDESNISDQGYSTTFSDLSTPGDKSPFAEGVDESIEALGEQTELSLDEQVTKDLKEHIKAPELDHQRGSVMLKHFEARIRALLEQILLNEKDDLIQWERDALFKKDVAIDGALDVGGNIITGGSIDADGNLNLHGTVNADRKIEFASDADMLWHELDDEFNLNKSLKVGDDLEVVNDTVVGGQLKIDGASRIRVTRTTVQTIPATAYIVILWNTETYDNLNEYTPANGKFTATVAGYYSVKASVLYDTCIWSSNIVMWLGLYKNNVLYSTFHRRQHRNASTYSTRQGLQGSDDIYLGVGDYITIRTWHNNTGAGPYQLYGGGGGYNYFCVHRLS